MGYPNLMAEMARRGITIIDLMRVTGKSRSGISNNIHGKGCFSIEEAINIRDALFPDLSIDYLFSEKALIHA